VPVAFRSVGASPGWGEEDKNNPTQPRSSENDQPGRAADFIDSIGQ